jgi:hypothetical protein
VYGQEAHVTAGDALTVSLPAIRLGDREGQFVRALIQTAVVQDEEDVRRDKREVTASPDSKFEVVE